MDKSTLELADELVVAGVKAEREKELENALAFFQQAIECFIHFVNCEYGDYNEYCKLYKQSFYDVIY